MTQEEKNLLLKDLCGRLPYEVKVEYRGESITLDYALFAKEYSLAFGQYPMKFNLDKLDTIKPYLRPMSNMTEEEKDYYDTITYTEDETHFKGVWCKSVVDWLNKKMFDYRGLIEKGIALAAPEEMYKN